MKKIAYTIFSLLVFLFLQSCKKNNDPVSKQYIIDTTLASGTMYLLNLQPYGDADDIAAIARQGNSFTTSEIINQAGRFAPVYRYSSVTKTTLTDQVVIGIKEGNSRNGNRCKNADSTTITINFTVK